MISENSDALAVALAVVSHAVSVIIREHRQALTQL
jgi:hypothetical protein